MLVYSTDRVTLVDTYQYNDSTANDRFQREPYSVKFRLHNAGACQAATAFHWQNTAVDSSPSNYS